MSGNAPKSYIICTSPRSGSTMLCKLLAATRIAGNPGSLFHEPSMQAWLEDYNLETTAFASRNEALKAIFSAAMARGTGETDIFGLRLQRGSFDFFMEQLGNLHPHCSTDRARLEAAFGSTVFIYLRRADKLGQAISYLRAEQTGLWHRRDDGTELERLEPTRRDGYDAAAIRAQIAEFTQYDAEWRHWFDAQSIKPLEISYETLANQPEAVLTEILNALGQDGAIARDVPVQTAKLADEITREWRARFQAEPA